ncbi:MAG: protein phosphatase [Deltaproteobacteria bacterium]|nr:protein phosphatase [Deltaproteobacteria bacterium]
MRLEAAGRTDTGPVRDNNEDNFLVDMDGGLFVVADGMGGHAAGEIASAIAVETVGEVLLQEVDPDETRISMDVGSPDGRIRERLRYTMNQASLRIRKEAMADPSQMGMGTTLVALLIEDGMAHLGHVGDSRAYRLRNGELTLLTKDHTVVQQEVDAGRLTPELARIMPHKNILTQSVGYHGPVDPDTMSEAVEPGDIYMLCSDGLTDPLDDEQLVGIMRGVPVDDLADLLVQKALEHGTEDNVTVVVVGVHEQ